MLRHDGGHSIPVVSVNRGYTAATPLPDPTMPSCRTTPRLLLVLLAVLLLGACGNKGPLVKPGAPAAPAPTH
jgi:hypothetical protein